MEFFLAGLVFAQPALQEADRGGEFVAEQDEQVDVVEIFLAAKTVGQVVAWVHRAARFAAVRAQETEIAVADFARRALAAQGLDDHGHRQVVTQSV